MSPTSSADIQLRSTESDDHEDDRYSGERSVANLEYLVADCEEKFRHLRLRCGMLCAIFNSQVVCGSRSEKVKAFNDIVNTQGSVDERLEAPTIKTPIIIDYGINVRIATSALLNRNCWIADSPLHSIIIGERVVVGVGVHIYGTHPVHWEEKTCRQGPSVAGPVRIEDDVSIGSYAVIMPGVVLGKGCAVGASAVVTRNVPAYQFAKGSPAYVVRKLRKVVLGDEQQSATNTAVDSSNDSPLTPTSRLPQFAVDHGGSHDPDLLDTPSAPAILREIIVVVLALLLVLSLVHDALG